MGTVHEFAPVKPKTLNKTYKQQRFTVTFVPATKKWHWSVDVVQTTTLSGDADTQVKAVRAAEKQIDQVLQVQGKAVR